jgi:hypothetical protein
MVRLHILKHKYDLSDEAVVQGLHETSTGWYFVEALVWIG